MFECCGPILEGKLWAKPKKRGEKDGIMLALDRVEQVEYSEYPPENRK